jgi:hypothetical protein
MVLDEDRYEHWRNPKHDRYFFRRLMWASLLSGGHTTYGGLKTYEPYDGELRGVQGYYDAVAAGKLEHGADDFVYIHKFFRDSGLTLVGMTPDDAVVGNMPGQYKCIRDAGNLIIYLANPDNPKPELADAGRDKASVKVKLPAGEFTGRWFNPRTGDWSDGDTVRGEDVSFKAPGGGDWVLLLRKK